MACGKGDAGATCVGRSGEPPLSVSSTPPFAFARPCTAALLATLVGLVAEAPALAAEAQFEGSYRARGRLFDTLSLDRALGDRNEGQAAYLEHRLWLRPRFLVSDAVALNVDFLGLNNVVWGSRPGVVTNYIDNPPQTFEQLLVPPPGSDPDQLSPGFNLWRAWGCLLYTSPSPRD